MTIRDYLSQDHHLRNATSIIGAVVTTVTALLFVGVFILDLFGFLGVHTNLTAGILIFIVLNLIVDILYAVLDPRIRLA